jgi:hypothetical protein
MNSRNRFDRVGGDRFIRSELCELYEARIARIEIGASRNVMRSA